MESTNDATRILNARYKLIKRIGSGGMASVYRAQDEILGRPVAVKLLHSGLTGDATFLERFRKEAHSVANLTHQNIVTVHDIGQDNDQYYIVMELVDGRTLKQVIRQQIGGQPLPINRALDLTIKICAGLGYAHRSGIVHCDVKPQNVLVRRDDRVKVTDFGIARAMTEATSHDGQVWGTPQYFAPEQAMGKPATPASDVYAIGIILFELLTGQLPFTAESHTALALKHINETPPSISDFNPTVPRQMSHLVNKALAKNPQDRFRTAGQFGQILSTYRRLGMDETGAAKPPQTTEQYSPRTGRIRAQPQPRRQHTPRKPVRPVTVAAPRPTNRSQSNRQPAALRPQPVARPPQPQQKNDWLVIALGLLAFLSIVMLIPLWWLVARSWGVL